MQAFAVKLTQFIPTTFRVLYAQKCICDRSSRTQTHLSLPNSNFWQQQCYNKICYWRCCTGATDEQHAEAKRKLSSAHAEITAPPNIR